VNINIFFSISIGFQKIWHVSCRNLLLGIPFLSIFLHIIKALAECMLHYKSICSTKKYLVLFSNFMLMSLHWLSKYYYFFVRLALAKPLKTADFSRRYHWFSRKVITDDMSPAISGYGLWLVEAHYPCGKTNQKHYPDLRSDRSLVQNFFTCSSFLGHFMGKPVWCRQELVVFFLGHYLLFIIIFLKFLFNFRPQVAHTQD